jgi:hypothetical protein
MDRLIKEPKMPPIYLMSSPSSILQGWICPYCHKHVLIGKYRSRGFKFWETKEDIECEHMGILDKTYYWKDEQC